MRVRKSRTFGGHEKRNQLRVVIVSCASLSSPLFFVVVNANCVDTRWICWHRWSRLVLSVQLASYENSSRICKACRSKGSSVLSLLYFVLCLSFHCVLVKSLPGYYFNWLTENKRYLISLCLFLYVSVVRSLTPFLSHALLFPPVMICCC